MSNMFLKCKCCSKPNQDKAL